MEVDARDVQACLSRARDRRERDLGREAELRAVLRRPDRRMRFGLDPGGDAYEDTANPGGRRTLDLVLGVEDDEPGARPRRGGKPPGTPARRANASFPSVETSARRPSAARSRSTATFGNALTL
ncbi:MAG TPA: hypothetical protein VHK22_03825 [Gaiellaceae bacterium]|nr:hypothetical protein [Gaiellaceae bacterium]